MNINQFYIKKQVEIKDLVKKFNKYKNDLEKSMDEIIFKCDDMINILDYYSENGFLELNNLYNDIMQIKKIIRGNRNDKEN